MADIARHIVGYDSDKLRSFIRVIDAGYEESKKIKIPYNVWIKRASEQITGSPKSYKTVMIEPGMVRYTDTKTVYAQLKSIEGETSVLKEKIEENPSMAKELNQELFNLQDKVLQPIKEFYYGGSTEIDGVKSWYSSSLNGVNVRIGPEGLDLSKPVGFFLSDSTVNGNIQGSTGSGKTVMITEMLFNIMMEYPPWEVDLKLIDNKEAELHLFARAAQAPHATVVAATKAKDFLLDLYSSFVEESKMRQEIFNATQTNSKKNFRKKFNLILPEIVIVIDEYVAMLLAIEDTAAMGNLKAGEEKQAIESVLLTLATQSRNAGIHFIISSQDLGSKLNENISKQIHVGATLGGTPDIYKGCINNTEVPIDRIGMSIMNLSRMKQDNASENALVGIPFISTDDKPNSLFNDAQELLLKICAKARELDFKKEFYFYDASIKIPVKKYIEDVSSSSTLMENSRGNMLVSIPLGLTISYRNIQTIMLNIYSRKGENILYYSKSDEISRYLGQIIVKTAMLLKDSLKVNLYYTNEEPFRISELEQLEPQPSITHIKMFNPQMFTVCENRVLVLQTQEVLFARSGKWDVLGAMTLVANSISRSSVFEKYKNKCEDEIALSLASGLTKEAMEQLTESVEPQDRSIFSQFLVKCNMLCNTRRINALDDTQRVTPDMFSPILNVWFDPEDIDNIKEDAYYDRVRSFFSNSTTVNILNVVNSKALSKTRKLLDEFNYVLEYANRDFCAEMEIGQGFIANANSYSLTVHDKRKSKNTIIKIYGGI